MVANRYQNSITQVFKHFNFWTIKKIQNLFINIRIPKPKQHAIGTTSWRKLDMFKKNEEWSIRMHARPSQT